jgi:predicted O-methyltransferase YrrM
MKMETKDRLHELKNRLKEIDKERTAIIQELETYLNPEGSRLYRSALVIGEMISLIKKEKRPITVLELYVHLGKVGITLSTNNPIKYLAAVTSREVARNSPRIKRVKYGYYTTN